MQKYLIALALISFPMVAMYSQITTADLENSTHSSESPAKPKLPTIVALSFFSSNQWSNQWHEVEATLSNGDILTYTKFPSLNNTSACIHTIPLNSVHEIRNNASQYWHEQMERIYLEKIRRLTRNC